MNARAVTLAAGLLFIAEGAGACFLEMDIGRGMVTSDPLAIPVLAAAREAMDAGSVVSLDTRDERKLSEAIAILSYVPRMLDGKITDAPTVRFAVLQAQSGYWTRYVVVAGVVQAEYHLSGPGDVEAILVVADSALLSVMLGEMPISRLGERGLIRSQGADSATALFAFEELLSRFGETRVAQRIKANPPKL